MLDVCVLKHTPFFLSSVRVLLLIRSELLQVMVQRVDPKLAPKGDGLVVDAILSIDTDRPSLKPLYRSALQVRESSRGTGKSSLS